MKQKIYNLLPIFLQNILVSIAGKQRRKYRYDNPISKNIVKEFNLSQEDQHLVAEQKLLKYLTEAKKESSFWKELITDDFLLNFKLEDVQQLPVISKKEILKNQASFENNSHTEKDYSILKTSGTTGTSFKFRFSNVALASGFTLWDKCGHHKIGDKYGTFNGNIVAPLTQKKPPFWRINNSANQSLFSIFHLKNEYFLSYYKELQNDYKYLNGYPSSIFLVAEYIVKNKLKPLKLEAIYTSSENLYKWQRNQMEQAFGCKIYDKYSNAEQTVLIYEDQSEKYFISPLFSHVWFKKAGVVVDGEEAYKVIGSSFNNSSTFFINYDTGDLVLLDKKRNVKKVLGREDDVLYLPDGRKIGRLDHLFKDAPDVLESQIIQESYHKLTIKIRLIDRNKFDSKQTILQEIENRISKDIEVHFEIVDNIPKQPNGKFKFVLRTF
jgi:phenylacetate-CoA ligase|tara:strand:+ start:1560 stop:2873 length:1314 start_codon:yes stop_codon:yes gene_type:complete